MNKLILSHFNQINFKMNVIGITRFTYIYIFGRNSWTWFLPVIGDLSCNGIRWPKINSNH